MKTPRFFTVRRAARELKRDVEYVAANSADVENPPVAPVDPFAAADVRVGLWDVGARIGYLQELVECLNASQASFMFVEVSSPVPSGLISTPERITEWARERKHRWSAADRESLVHNVIAEDFFDQAEQVHRDLRRDIKLNYLLGLTAAMVAGDDEDGIYWNHFSTFKGKLALASTYELREFAKRARCPFESLVGIVVVAQLLVAMNWPRLGFHENRGCLFDYDEQRYTIAQKAKNATIEQKCLSFIRPRHRAAAAALVEALKKVSKMSEGGGR